MIAHILEACSIALKYRKNVNLPIGAPPEERARKKDLYTYSVFMAALLKHIGSALFKQRPKLYDWRGKYLCEWNPLLEELGWHSKARFMKTGSGKIVLNSHRPMESLMYLARILPNTGLVWLHEDREVYGQFLDAMSDAPRGPIYELVMKACRACEDEVLPEMVRGQRKDIPTQDTGAVQEKRTQAIDEVKNPRPVKEIQAPKAKSRNTTPRKNLRKSPTVIEKPLTDTTVATSPAGSDQVLMS